MAAGLFMRLTSWLRLRRTARSHTSLPVSRSKHCVNSFVVFKAGQEYVVISEYWRGLASANRHSPDGVLVLGELHRKGGVLRHAGAVWTTKARPVFPGRRGWENRQRELQQPDLQNSAFHV